MINTYTFEEIVKLSKKDQLPKELLECIDKHLRSIGGVMLWKSGMKSGVIVTFENVTWNFGEKIVTIHSQDSDKN